MNASDKRERERDESFLISPSRTLLVTLIAFKIQAVKNSLFAMRARFLKYF